MSHHECCCGCNDNREAVRENARAALTPDLVAFIEECAADAHPESQLIRVLHRVQGHYGHLGREQMDAVAQLLQVPASKVTGVATFYHFFRLEPRGKFMISVCLGTACYVKGAADVLAAVEKEARIRAGDTTADEELSLLTARCIGACGIAPAVVYDGKVCARQTPESALEHVKGWIRHVAE